MITCGAKVLGNITIGDDAVIDANAVVVHSHLKNKITLVGIPAVDI
jgi:serine acetyltransferase